MNYVSTRGGMAPRAFTEILLEGLAPDGGLVVPHSMARVSLAELEIWRSLGYADLATEIMNKFVGDIDRDQLRLLAHATYNAENFGSDEITPLRELGGGLYLLGLSNGPSLAFKDIAMQWLGRLFEHVLAARDERLTILGATSGDTGSAAEYAMRGRAGVRVFMLSPLGRMSAFQTAQMYSLTDRNIFNIAIEGVFDQAQDIVKELSSDAEFKTSEHLATVNSINWARIVAQVVYYFRGYFLATRSNDEQVSFTVPSGNFGNIYSGHIARLMGLPIDRLVCATNENDVLYEFFTTGQYRMRTAAQTEQTSSPSMDISRASNFERLVFDLFDGDSLRVAQLWDRLALEGSFDLAGTVEFARARDEFGFAAGHSTHAERIETIRRVDAECGLVIDPHTADGITVARPFCRPGVPMIVLETALPAKFSTTIEEALGREAPRPAAFEGIESLPQRFSVLPASAWAVREFIVSQA